MNKVTNYIFMLNLYIKTGCGYCGRVLEANKTFNAPLQLLTISGNQALRDELIEKGGKAQAPFLEDTDRGISMYESLDIIAYLKEHFGNGAEVTISKMPNVCPVE